MIVLCAGLGARLLALHDISCLMPILATVTVSQNELAHSLSLTMLADSLAPEGELYYRINRGVLND